MDSLLPGMIIIHDGRGRFQLDEKIDEGGTADIWLATDLSVPQDSPKSKVVVKAVRSDCISRAVTSKDQRHYAERLIERLERECTFHRELSPNRNIVQFLASGKLPSGNPYIAMEHLSGKPLLYLIHRSAAKHGIMRVHMEDGKRCAVRIDPTDCDGIISEESVMEEKDIRKIFEGVLRALAHLHANGVTHRDLKPDNIIILSEPNDPESIAGAKILDFGLAKASAEVLDLFRAEKQLTEEGYVLGTPTYMPIEQFNDCSQSGPQADVYAAGIILFEAITGLKPYTNCSQYLQVYQAVQEAVSFDPAKYVRNLPHGLREVVMKATQRAKEDRYANAFEMLNAFRSVRWPKLNLRPTSGAKSRLSGPKRPPLPPRPKPKSDPPPPPSRRKQDPPAEPSAPELEVISEILSDPLLESQESVSDASTPLPAFSEARVESDRPSPPLAPSRPLPPLSPPPPKRISDRPSPLLVPQSGGLVRSIPPPPPLPRIGSDRTSPLPPPEPASRESNGRSGGFVIAVVGLVALVIGVGGGFYYIRHDDVFSRIGAHIEAALFDQEPSKKEVPVRKTGANRTPERLPVFNPVPHRSAHVYAPTSARAPSSFVMDDSARVLYRMGLKLFRQGRYATALKKFRSAEKIDPNNPEISVMIAKCNQRMRLHQRRKR